MRPALLLLVAACGSPAAAPDAAAIPADAPLRSPDADPALACLDQPRPSSTPDPVTFGGKVFEVVDFQVQAAAGATVELRARTDEGNLLASTTTGDDGSFAFTIASGPVDAIVATAIAGDLPTREIPADPLVGGENLLVVSASADEVARWQAAPYDPAERTLLVGVEDCDDAGAAGATVATTPTSAILYYDDQAHDFDPLLDASSNGFALAADAPAALTVGAAIGGVSLPARAITTVGGTLTIAAVSPRR